ncbi:hypothetical protein DMUE_5121 [Dictyocoela muelleri]|nr:hypothetical protein DMUE_5121 [Dictyocoela muelleri]
MMNIKKNISLKQKETKQAFLLNYYYHFKNMKNMIQIYRCSKRPCKGKLMIESDFVKKEILHDCISLNPIHIKKNLLVCKIRQYANESLLNNKQIICEIFKDIDTSKYCIFKAKKTLKRIINNKRENKINNFNNTATSSKMIKIQHQRGFISTT